MAQDYILEPLDTDADAIYQEFVDYIQATYPNWEPSDGQLDVLIGRFVSLKMAVIADMASRVQRGIFRYFGSTIVNIQPITAVPATASMNITALNTVGYTLAANTAVGIRDVLGDLQVFITDNDAVIPPGQTTLAGVSITALEFGTASNGLSGTVEMINQVDWLSSATVVAPSSGGIDDESDEDYINRLTVNLGLMAPRPVLAADFALLARNISGIWRARGIDNWLPGTNEVQTISHNYTGNGATGGTITWNGATTAALAWNATAAQVQSALEALINVEVGDIVATGGPWPAAITLTFQGRQAYTNVAQITASAGTWTGGTTITINTTVGGVAPNAAAENAVVVSAIDIQGLTASPTLKTTLDTYLQSLRQQNFIINIVDAAYTVIDATFTVVKHPAALAADVQSKTVENVTDFLSSAVWGVPTWPTDARGWDNWTVLRAQELYAVLNNTEGVDYVSSLNFSNGAGAAQDGTDKTLLGVFPLTKPGTISATVV